MKTKVVSCAVLALLFISQALAQPQLLSDIRTGTQNSNTVVGGVSTAEYLYFFATDGTNQGVYYYDGLTVGRVQGIYGTPHLFVYHGAAYALIPTNTSGQGQKGIWKIDGTTASVLAGSEDITPIREDQRVPVVFDDRIFFTGFDSGGGGYRDGLYMTGGSNFSMVKDFDYEVTALAVADNVMYIFEGPLNISANTGFRVWRMESRNNDPVQIGECTTCRENNLGNRVSVGTILYYQTGDYSTGNELWYANSNEIGPLPEIVPGTGAGMPQNLTSYDGLLFFTARPDGGADRKLMVFNGSGYTVVDDRIVYIIGSTHYHPIMNFGGSLYMGVLEGAQQNLYRYHHSEGFVKITPDFNSLMAGKHSAIVYKGHFYFRAADASYQQELWRTDGTSAELLYDPDPSQGTSSNPSIIGLFGDELVYRANVQPYGSEPWVYVDTGGGGGGTTTTTLQAFDSGLDQQTWVIDWAAPVDSGFVFGTNFYQDQAKATAFTTPAGKLGAQVTEVKVWWSYKSEALSTQSYQLQILDGNAASGPASSPLYSRSYALSSVSADSDFNTTEGATVYTIDPPVSVGSSFFVSIDFGSYGSADNGNASIASSPMLGYRVDEAWEKSSSGTWTNISDAWMSGADGWEMWIEATVETGTGVANEDDQEVPAVLTLDPNYPNPFNPETTISFSLPQHGAVRLAVYDVLGREVERLLDGSYPAGAHRVRFDGSSLSSGLYLYRLENEGSVLTRSMILMK